MRADVRPCAFCSERIGVGVQHARGWDSPNHLPQALTGPYKPLSLTARIDQHYDERRAHEDREFARRSAAIMANILRREEVEDGPQPSEST